MPREIPDVPIDWQKPTVDGGRCFHIELITPIFGGGVETRTNDPSFPIRPTAIRGQLQFWWRATVGAQYATPQELRAAQSEIWGSTERPSQVQVLVEGVQAGKPEQCARFDPDKKNTGKYRSTPTWNPPFNNTSLPYALFPFQGQLANRGMQIEVEPAACIRKASFCLVLRCANNLWPQVEPALWAWLNFGGLGSRTRRGCGSIRCSTLVPKDHGELINRLKEFRQNAPQAREWPTLAAAILLGSEQRDAMTAWDRVVGLLRHFRQGDGSGRNPGQQPNRPGRSRFPEPETIRRVTNRRSSLHGRLPHIPDDAFPRAELGLPIVFHFKDDRAGDPRDTVLYPPKGSDGQPGQRMASPLILKPLALANNKAIPLILRLKTPVLTGVDLRQGDTSLPLPPTTVIVDPRLSSYRDSPLAGSPNGSALEAFLAFARSQGFTELPQ
jgi:CRISPR-associated protein Cmr1